MASLIVSILGSLFFLLSPLQASSQQGVASKEKKVIKMINKVREKNGLRPLKVWKALTRCARKHSQNMAKKRVAVGHDGFKKRGREMNKHARWRRFGENVAYSLNVKDHLKTAVWGWMKSPGHRKNILGDYEETGIGIAFGKDGSFYITQLFATRF